MATSTGKPALQVRAYHEHTTSGDSGTVVINGSQAGGTGRETGGLAP